MTEAKATREGYGDALAELAKKNKDNEPFYTETVHQVDGMRIAERIVRAEHEAMCAVVDAVRKMIEMCDDKDSEYCRESCEARIVYEALEALDAT